MRVIDILLQAGCDPDTRVEVTRAPPRVGFDGPRGPLWHTWSRCPSMTDTIEDRHEVELTFAGLAAQPEDDCCTQCMNRLFGFTQIVDRDILQMAMFLTREVTASSLIARISRLRLTVNNLTGNTIPELAQLCRDKAAALKAEADELAASPDYPWRAGWFTLVALSERSPEVAERLAREGLPDRVAELEKIAGRKLAKRASTMGASVSAYEDKLHPRLAKVWHAANEDNAWYQDRSHIEGLTGLCTRWDPHAPQVRYLPTVLQVARVAETCHWVCQAPDATALDVAWGLTQYKRTSDKLEPAVHALVAARSC